ncbi:MAG: hypothetical protein ACRDQU_17765 [Pseudonocardiaceae bacterium]
MGVLRRCGLQPRRVGTAAAGRHRAPTQLTAQDGIEGWPDHAPYDRIIATCSVPRVPWAWAKQLTPGGKLLRRCTRRTVPGATSTSPPSRTARGGFVTAAPPALGTGRARLPALAPVGSTHLGTLRGSPSPRRWRKSGWTIPMENSGGRSDQQQRHVHHEMNRCRCRYRAGGGTGSLMVILGLATIRAAFKCSAMRAL